MSIIFPIKSFHVYSSAAMTPFVNLTFNSNRSQELHGRGGDLNGDPFVDASEHMRLINRGNLVVDIASVP